MKLNVLVILLASSFTSSALAAECSLTWMQNNRKVGVELVQEKQGCKFTTEEPEACFILKSIGLEEQEIGATVFRKSTPPQSYCLENQEQDAFVSDTGIRAMIECAGINKPKGIRLESPDKKHSKACPFPFKNSN